MKKIILICLSIGLSHSFYAQQVRDFAFFNHRIDSLAQFYSTNQWQEMIYGNYFDYTNLNEKEKMELIIKIRKLFEQKEYANLYRYGHRIIYDMWWMYPDNNSLEIKQNLMELYLQYYFYPGADRIISRYDFYKDWDHLFSKKNRQRLIEILENKKTQEEYEAWLNFEKSLPEDILISEKLAQGLMKKRGLQNDTILQQLRDSIYTGYVREGANKNYESLQIKPDPIRIIGLLNMKECVPALKKNLQSCIQNKCQGEQVKAYRYALARLGDKEQRQYILDNLMDIGSNNQSDEKYFDRRDFYYFQDDEMVWKYIDVNYNSEKMIGILSDVSLPASLKTMNDVYPFIKNVPEELKYPYLSDDMAAHYRWAKSFYEWLVANKNKIKFDYRGKKDWFW